MIVPRRKACGFSEVSWPIVLGFFIIKSYSGLLAAALLFAMEYAKESGSGS